MAVFAGDHVDNEGDIGTWTKPDLKSDPTMLRSNQCDLWREVVVCQQRHRAVQEDLLAPADALD